MRTRADRLLGLEDVVRILRDEVERAGSQAEWARQESVHSPDLCSTVTGKRPPTKDILRALRLKKAFAYQSISGRNRRLLKLEEVVRRLRAEVETAGGQAVWARKTGVNRPNMNCALTGKRPPMNDVLRALGLRKVYAYEKDIKI